MTDPLAARLKGLVARTLRLPTDPATLADDVRLVGNPELGIEIDSVDFLELVVALQKEFGIAIEDGATARRVFQDLASLAAFVREKAPPERLRQVS